VTNRDLLEAAVILRGLEHPIPPDVDATWFQWPPARAAWRVLCAARQEGRDLALVDLLVDPATHPVTEALPDVAYYITGIEDAVRALQVYVDREWLGQQWRAAWTRLQDPETDVQTVMAELMTVLDHRLTGARTGALVPLGEAVQRVWKGLERRTAGEETPLPYGWPSWDALTHGMEGGQLVLIGARPGIGKTLVATNLARHWAQAGHAVLYLSLEMRAERLAARWMAAESGLNSLTLARGMIHDTDDWGTLSRALGHVSQWPIWIREEPTTLTECVHVVRQAVRDQHIAVAIIDYAGLLGNEPVYRGESTAAQVGRIAKTLKNLAMAVNRPVVTLVQINRSVEHRTDGVPTLADLRDTGDWEASADVAWLLMPSDHPDELITILAKNRDGEANVRIRMGWQKKTAMIWDAEVAHG
jgi:replicative DNA helicase